MVTLTKPEFESLDDRAIKTYLYKVYALFQSRQKGCTNEIDTSLDMSLHGIMAFTQWTQEYWTGEAEFNVLTSLDVLATFDNINQI